MLWALWALVGWCGTPWRRHWPWPPPPPPDGDPWLVKGGNVIGGILGGWGFEQIWPVGTPVTGVAVAATALGAYVGSVVLGDVVGLLRGAKKV